MSDLTFIHTADVHLGRCFRELGRTGRTLRDRVGEAFLRTADHAVDRGARLVLVAGDLFDSPYPSRSSLLCLERALTRLGNAGIRVVIMPGTHDPPGSPVYEEKIFKSDGLTLLTPDSPVVGFTDLDLAVAAFFPTEREDMWTSPPVDWGQGLSFRVAMAHGSALAGLEDRARDLIPASVLRSVGVDYFALGHHHGSGPAPGASCPCYYCGSPEILAVDQKEAGYALLVSLGGGGKTEVEKLETGSLKYVRLAVDLGELAGGLDLYGKVEQMADVNLILDLEITGMKGLDALDPAEMIEPLGERFFRLRVTDRAMTERGAMEAPRSSVLAEFIALMEIKISESEGRDKKQWEEALRLGVHYLTGGDVKS